MRLGTWSNQGSMCRGGAGRLGTPVSNPHSAAAVSAQRAASGRRKPCGTRLHAHPERPGLPRQRLQAGTKARGRAASPQRPLRASGQSQEKEDEGPQGNQDAVPALLERKAQPLRARGAGVREEPETPARRAPRATPGAGWLSGSHPEGPPRRGESQRPSPRQGSPAYLAESCAPCCPSLRRGAALAAARSGRTEANYAVGRGPGPGSGSLTSRLQGEPAGDS